MIQGLKNVSRDTGDLLSPFISRVFILRQPLCHTGPRSTRFPRVTANNLIRNHFNRTLEQTLTGLAWVTCPSLHQLLWQEEKYSGIRAAICPHTVDGLREEEGESPEKIGVTLTEVRMEARQAETSSIDHYHLRGLPGAVLGDSTGTIPYGQLHDEGLLIILRMRKLRLRKTQALAQGHTISKGPQTPNLLDRKTQALDHLLSYHNQI